MDSHYPALKTVFWEALARSPGPDRADFLGGARRTDEALRAKDRKKNR
jgi:hypothetical protein